MNGKVTKFRGNSPMCHVLGHFKTVLASFSLLSSYTHTQKFMQRSTHKSIQAYMCINMNSFKHTLSCLAADSS